MPTDGSGGRGPRQRARRPGPVAGVDARLTAGQPLSTPATTPWLPLVWAGGAASAAMAVRIHQLTNRLRRRALAAEAVAELSHWALTADQPDDLLRGALRVAVEATGADYGTALRLLPDGQLRVANELGPQPLPAGTILPLAPKRSYALHVVRTGTAFVSADLRNDPRITPPAPLLARGVISGLTVPVRGSERVLGLLALHSRRRRRFRPDDVDLANALAAVVATAWEQAAHREQLGHQALHDPLTGLPNRALFLDRLDHALARRPSSDPAAQPGVAVVLIDLDDFKGVNDSFGHAAGDELLTVAARRFQDIVRPHDTIARLGGDEFALLCDPVPDEATAMAIAHRMQEVCSQPVVVAGSPLTVSASFGITWTHREAPVRTRTAAVLLGEADTALYRAKEQGRGQVQLYDERLQRSTGQRRRLEAELQAALERDEFRLHYQPVRRTGGLHTVGVEALLRWEHPSRGLLLPGDFIPTAEKTGLLVPLGTWVLRAACRQAAAWRHDAVAADRPFWMAVNVSPRQLDDPELAETIDTILADTALTRGSLALELTESAILAGDGDHRAALRRLRETGVQLFLDDFGTGYSSLTHLTQLPIDAVKIDRSFVAGLPGSRRNAAVVSSLIGLSAELGLDVIAEGVETTEQLHALELMQCRSVQGFLLDRPRAAPLLAPPSLPAEARQRVTRA